MAPTSEKGCMPWMPPASNPTQGCQCASCFFPVVTLLLSAFIAFLGVSILLRGTTSLVVTFQVTAAFIAMDFLSLIQDWVGHACAPVGQSLQFPRFAGAKHPPSGALCKITFTEG